MNFRLKKKSKNYETVVLVGHKKCKVLCVCKLFTFPETPCAAQMSDWLHWPLFLIKFYSRVTPLSPFRNLLNFCNCMYRKKTLHTSQNHNQWLFHMYLCMDLFIFWTQHRFCKSGGLVTAIPSPPPTQKNVLICRGDF